MIYQDLVNLTFLHKILISKEQLLEELEEAEVNLKREAMKEKQFVSWQNKFDLI